MSYLPFFVTIQTFFLVGYFGFFIEIFINFLYFKKSNRQNRNPCKKIQALCSPLAYDSPAVQGDKKNQSRIDFCVEYKVILCITVKKSVGKQQISSKILLNFVKEINENFPILKEARREVTEDYMDIKNAKKILERIENKKTRIEVISTTIPTPFAFNLIAQGYMDILRYEERIEFIRRMHEAILLQIEEKNIYGEI